ncbi:unnamed protein product, partial [Lymnaea stagnalis]
MTSAPRGPTGTPNRNYTHETSHVESLTSQIEEEFLHAVDFGDVTLVKDLLERYPNLNVDCTDALGRTPLRLAVKNEHKELVELLLCLSSADNMNEAVLQAIDSGATNIAEITLRHPRYLETSKRMRRMGDMEGFFKPERGSQFPSYVTPLILAAQKNQYVIVQLLLQRGESIIKPHKFGCACQECINKSKFDQLRSAKCRLDAFRGLSSEAYISLYSKDPFLTAFELAEELRKLATAEVFFKKEYTDLAEQLSNYVVKLLDRVWTHRELSAVLDKCGPPHEDMFESLARLKMAVELEEKLFVAHPNCQQRIDRCWYEGLEKLNLLNWPKRLAIILLFLLTYPLCVGYFLVSPTSKISKYLKVPCVKFVSHTLSFFVFLILIIVSCIEQIYMTSSANSLKSRHPSDAYDVYKDFRLKKHFAGCGEDFPLRTFDPTVSEIMILIWIIAMVVQECQELWAQGVKNHLSDKFNILDFMLLSVYIATYSLKYMCAQKWQESLDGLKYERNLTVRKMETYIYWLNADRVYWEPYDPTNFAEGLFAMANILSFSRIAYLLRANETLGPLQISLGRMIDDILKFFALAVIVIIAFIVALRNLYWYYSNRKNIELNPDLVQEPDAVAAYGDLLAIFRTVFWSIYGRGEDKAVSLGEYNNTLTEKIGETIDGMYHITMIILLLNILVAMMTRTFDKTAEDSDIEWKFARSVLYLEYITKGRVLPVPFNILEVCYMLINHLITRLREKKQEVVSDRQIHYDGGRRTAISNIASQRHLKNKKKTVNETPVDPTPTGEAVVARSRRFTQQPKSIKGLSLYQEVIQCIIQRFIYDIHREDETTVGTEEVKSCFERMRQEVLSQYKVKDESLNMALSAVQCVSWHIDLIGGNASEEFKVPGKELFSWFRGESQESKDSALSPDMMIYKSD